MSKVTAKYQFTIPLKVRKELGIVPGTEVDIKKNGEKYFKGGPTTMEYMDEIRGKVN